MTTAMRVGLRKYVTVSGRASRSEYWWWLLSSVLLVHLAGMIDDFLIEPFFGLGAPADEFQPLSSLIDLVLLAPTITVGVRRLQDLGSSGWWMLLVLFPVFGFLVLMYYATRPSESGENAFGPEPVWPPAV